MNEPKIYQRKRYTANTPVARAVSELIEKYGGRLVLEAVADYYFQNLGLRCFAAGLRRIIAYQLVRSGPKRRSTPSAVLVHTQLQVTARLLWQRLRHNADWIKINISVSDEPPPLLEAYMEWFFELLKDQIPAEPSEAELDRMIRNLVKSIFGEFRDRSAGQPYARDAADQLANQFEEDIEITDELQASLECVSEESRQLILEVFTYADPDVADSRDRLAARLGITRNALDQRLSRAYKRIREGMHGKRGPKRL